MGALACFKAAARYRPRRQGSSSHTLLPYPTNCAAGCDRLLRRNPDRLPLHARPNAYIDFVAPQRNSACGIASNPSSDLVGPTFGGASGASTCSATRRYSCLDSAWVVCREYGRSITRGCLHPLLRERFKIAVQERARRHHLCCVRRLCRSYVDVFFGCCGRRAKRTG